MREKLVDRGRIGEIKVVQGAPFVDASFQFPTRVQRYLDEAVSISGRDRGLTYF